MHATNEPRATDLDQTGPTPPVDNTSHFGDCLSDTCVYVELEDFVGFTITSTDMELIQGRCMSYNLSIDINSLRRLHDALMEHFPENERFEPSIPSLYRLGKFPETVCIGHAQSVALVVDQSWGTIWKNEDACHFACISDLYKHMRTSFRAHIAVRLRINEVYQMYQDGIRIVVCDDMEVYPIDRPLSREEVTLVEGRVTSQTTGFYEFDG